MNKKKKAELLGGVLPKKTEKPPFDIDSAKKMLEEGAEDMMVYCSGCGINTGIPILTVTSLLDNFRYKKGDYLEETCCSMCQEEIVSRTEKEIAVKNFLSNNS